MESKPESTSSASSNAPASSFSDDELIALAAKAKLELSPANIQDFKTNLGKIVAMFHHMADVGVCEHKQAGIQTINYTDLRDGKSQPTMTSEKLSSCCAHYNSSTMYFDVPAVIENEN